ncbi:MaoC/PaaZ C-terminal domain-containing protein [Bradyrhizobium sp. CB3481]|uniref:MaoC/PaaZ C-terminal domain-containing protein n=1 Tax=Bradyrhizobium sp. CB3481 TaxID=3039158 RepID=UPI0024B27AFB|nr:MaoC/PaaZ C-terminal domain-containing protein [Bradyrhizobium sp. CB3481]WFU14670.1 MaoC/PaaZ C-terminal domain-containing protein [Bradyrhizobium sp. CB3481]
MIIAKKPAFWQVPSFSKFDIGRTHTVTRTFSETEVDAFGCLSGDLNPLHMNDEFASHSPFGRRVVHGLLTAALVSRTHSGLTGPGFAYVGQELPFLKSGVHRQDHDGGHYCLQEGSQAILILDTMVRKHTGEAVLSGLSAYRCLSFR